MFNDKLVLIVEDNVFLALDLSQAVEELDGRVAGPTNRISQAIELLDGEEIAVAIVDCHLIGEDVVMLTGKLVERQVPFVFHVETHLPETISALHPTIPVLRKPVQTHSVMECLLAEMRRSAA